MTGLSSSEAMTTGGLIGALVGAVTGAAVGAGPSAPKLPPSTGVSGLGAEIPAPTMINTGDVWQLDITSDQPVSPQQFFDLVSSFQGELEGKSKTLSFSAIDQTHFRTIVQMLRPQAYHGPGDSEVVDGIKFTVTDGKPYVAAEAESITPPTSGSGVSTGAVFGIGGVAALLSGAAWLATRKKKRSRRR
jgi:LPXTG-motif cell wall-anchored protein